MRNIKRLTESQLVRLVKRVIKEQEDTDSSDKLYRMYSRDIDSEIRNIEESIRTIDEYMGQIEDDDKLDHDDKEHLLFLIYDFLESINRD